MVKDAIVYLIISWTFIDFQAFFSFLESISLEEFSPRATVYYPVFYLIYLNYLFKAYIYGTEGIK